MNDVNRMLSINRVKFTSDPSILKKIAMGSPDSYSSSIAINKIKNEEDLVDISLNSRYSSNRSEAFHRLEDCRNILKVYLLTGKKYKYSLHASKHIKDDSVLIDIIIENYHSPEIYDEAIKNISKKVSISKLINRVDNEIEKNKLKSNSYNIIRIKAEEKLSEMSNGLDFILGDYY